MSSKTIFIHHLESSCALALESRGVGTYTQNLSIQGDGIYSSVLVKSISAGATIDVSYYTTTLGGQMGERIELGSHTQIDDSAVLPFNNHLCIPKAHNSVYVEATVTGGTAEFSAFVSSRHISSLDKILDTTGEVPITTKAGTPYHFNDSTTSVDSSKEEVFTFTVPVGTTRKLTQIIGNSCGEEGVFTLEDDASGDILAEFTSTPANLTIPFKFEPSRPISAGATIKLYFTANTDNGGGTVRGFVMANDVT